MTSNIRARAQVVCLLMLLAPCIFSPVPSEVFPVRRVFNTRDAAFLHYRSGSSGL